MDDAAVLVLLLVAAAPLLVGVFIGSIISGALRYLMARKGRATAKATDKLSNAVGLFGNYVLSVGSTGATVKLRPGDAQRYVTDLIHTLKVADEMLSSKPYNVPGVASAAINDALACVGIITGPQPPPPEHLAQLWRAQISGLNAVAAIRKILLQKHTSLCE